MSFSSNELKNSIPRMGSDLDLSSLRLPQDLPGPINAHQSPAPNEGNVSLSQHSVHNESITSLEEFMPEMPDPSLHLNSQLQTNHLQ